MVARAMAFEAAGDLYFGQVVIIWARWFVITGAALLALWGAPDERALAAATALVLALMGVNFFLHARQVAGRPANALLVTGASLFDLLTITVMALSWPGAGGLDTRYVAFFYPIVFAFALVFRPRQAIVYTLLALAAYVCVSLVGEGTGLLTVERFEPFLMRLITLGSMGLLGTYYWRIQRRRRDGVLAAPPGEHY